MKYGIVGATGRVGKLLVKILKEENEKIGAVMFNGKQTINFDSDTIITNDAEELLKNCDIAIDFSAPIATENLLEAAIKNPKPLVIATTGLNEHQKNLMIEASKKCPILYATNMSLGIAILNKLVAMVSEKLRDFDIEITEQHHRYKVDAPSGTALTLAESCAKARGLNLKDVIVTGRSGHVGPRSKDEIGVFAIRGGDVVGRHTVGFYNDGEFLELHHTATSRETFARGAIKVAKWLINQKPGLYSINDALGL
ncbi:4-hydroxy-tetrahydrodipicolinate reductase [Caminibacter mediatlanticus TB-2]|uniref:4-hydroxy-tetrahydrodipicolinate reductase n=1 Tax=Caminibacter mediatlanticus TB-2 TaxID=391592 RepID=A0AAI9F385_9BACT|nr:4-hydroxy-tetrahydrodipicolinate reductase [Caminibacter mediatlanticus]EDM24589.1 dihydrodipicolinate reductase [Caminibacter mediatlanticus TB-2]QCT95232.1 4-hydroxy-tetrahydrodipicolinate reductase [Caminibacter mediatlanticus TB-2]